MNFKDIKPKDCYKALESSKNCLLIDVRSEAEHSLVGVVDLSKINCEPILLPLFNYPSMTLDNDFSFKLIEIIRDKYQDISKENLKLFFICKIGGRSSKAAQIMSDLNFECFNVVGGFEGDLDKNHHRSSLNGWKFDKLPWRQT